MRLPTMVIPLLVVLALLAGYAARLAFTRPTTVTAYADQPGVQAAFVVEGVRCKGTAMFFAALYENTPGIFRIETFASEHKAVFTYDPKVITPDRIRAVMEAPVTFDDGTSQQVFKCRSVE